MRGKNVAFFLRLVLVASAKEVESSWGASYRLANAWLSRITVDPRKRYQVGRLRVTRSSLQCWSSSCLISMAKSALASRINQSDESAANELLQTAVGARPNDESISNAASGGEA